MAKKKTINRTITHYIDPTCEMAGVYLDGKCIMLGNFWDFHPYCHGIHEWGQFRSARALVTAIKTKLESKGYTVTVERHENARYRDGRISFLVG